MSGRSLPADSGRGSPFCARRMALRNDSTEFRFKFAGLTAQGLRARAERLLGGPGKYRGRVQKGLPTDGLTPGGGPDNGHDSPEIVSRELQKPKTTRQRPKTTQYGLKTAPKKPKTGLNTA
eukprot:4673309-Pyramimonas_sp.AAC.1